MLRQAREPALLVPRHGRRRRVAPRRAATLDLDEDHDVAVAAHEVDLAVAQADVALEDAKAGAREVRGRRVFRRAAERLPGIPPPAVHARWYSARGVDTECPQFETLSRATTQRRKIDGKSFSNANLDGMPTTGLELGDRPALDRLRAVPIFGMLVVIFAFANFSLPLRGRSRAA